MLNVGLMAAPGGPTHSPRSVEVPNDQARGTGGADSTAETRAERTPSQGCLRGGSSVYGVYRGLVGFISDAVPQQAGGFKQRIPIVGPHDVGGQILVTTGCPPWSADVGRAEGDEQLDTVRQGFIHPGNVAPLLEAALSW